MRYGQTCPKCEWFETDYNNPREDMCKECADREFLDSHNGVDRVTDFLYPGLKRFIGNA